MYVVRVDGADERVVVADSPERAVECFVRAASLAPGNYRASVRADDGGETLLPMSVRRTITVGAGDESVISMLLAEIERSREAHPRPMASAHEAWGVLAEEFSELQAEIMEKDVDQDHDAMAAEAIDIACAALRFVLEVCQRGRSDVAPIMIDPPKAAQEAARAALAAREAAPKSKRGGLDTREAGEQRIGSGVARARDIAAGKQVDARRVAAFFSRHQGNYEAAKSKGLSLEDSPALQAWGLWGGEPMRRSAEAAVERERNKADR